jgi:anti-anti-sigma regulatory factor
MVDDHWDDTTVILSCTGTLDMLTALELERRTAGALDKRPTSVIVDLLGVDFRLTEIITAHPTLTDALKDLRA